MKILLLSFFAVIIGAFFLGAKEAQAALPVGHVDEVTANGIIRGWAQDPDLIGVHIEVHAYFDGPAGTSTTVVGSSTNLPRCDVHLRENDCGFQYGYEIVVPSHLRDGKTHKVYVYAVGIDSSWYQTGESSLLAGSLKSFVLGSAPSSVNKKPIGNFDVVTDSDWTIRGWALDPDHQDQSVEIHFYFDGQAGQPNVYSFADRAMQMRTDVNSVTGFSGNHGFSIPVPASLRNNLTHTLYIYVIDRDDPSGSSNILLPGSPKTFKFDTYLHVTSPNGGEVWQSGTQQTIKWVDNSYNSNSGSYYTVFVVRQNGGAYGIAANAVYGKEFLWTVGKLEGATSLSAGNEYYIQVVKQFSGTPEFDQTDAAFSIVK